MVAQLSLFGGSVPASVPGGSASCARPSWSCRACGFRLVCPCSPVCVPWAFSALGPPCGPGSWLCRGCRVRVLLAQRSRRLARPVRPVALPLGLSVPFPPARPWRLCASGHSVPVGYSSCVICPPASAGEEHQQAAA